MSAGSPALRRALPRRAERPARRSWAAHATRPGVLWAVAGLGVALRLARYAADRSLWIDEVFLALNVLHRSVSQLLDPLAYYQGAPVGFLVAERAAISAFGGGEYALRLVPLLAAVLSVPLFTVLARRVLDPVGALVAVVCFALAAPLISYGAQVKPYSLDVLVAVALLLAAWRCVEADGRPAPVWLLGFLGAIALWLSFPAAILLAAIWCALTAMAVRARRWRGVGALAGVAAVWAGSGAAEYVLALRHLRAVRFSPIQPDSGYVPHGLWDGSWYVDSALGAFRTTLGAPRPLVGACVLVALAGCVALWRCDRRLLALLLLPVAAALLAAVARLYGFGSRFSQFLVPAVILVLAAGIAALLRADRRGTRVGVIGFALVAGGIGALGLRSVPAPSPEEIKPVLADVAAHERPADAIFVDYWAQYAYAYYAPRYGLPVRTTGEVLAGRSAAADASAYPPALRSAPPRLLVGPSQGYLIHGLRGLGALPRRGRVWLIFSHAEPGSQLDEQALYRVAFQHRGRLVRAYRAHGAAAYLYRLTPGAGAV